MSLLQHIMTPPIGVDVGERLIKAVQLGHKRSGPAVTASATIKRPGDDPVISRKDVERLARVFTQQGFRGRRVVLSAPVCRTASAVIDMPPRESGAPYDIIAAQEFARLQRLDPGSFELTWWDVPKPARSSAAKVMAMGCAHADSVPVLDVFEQAGFDVVAMDVGLCAAVKACGELLGPAGGVSAVLDMGWGSSRLAMVHGGVVVFERVLAGSGIKPLRDTIASSLRVEPTEAETLLQNIGLVTAEAAEHPVDDGRVGTVAPMLRPFITDYLDDIAEALDASFEYTAHQYPKAEATRMALVGGGGCVPGVASYLNERAPVEVVAAAANDTMTYPSLMASALGLAGYGELKQAA